MLNSKKFLGLLGFLLTIIKPLYVLIAVYFIVYRFTLLATLLIIIIIVSDIFDGVLFRKSNLTSNENLTKLRRIIDIIGDRIAIEGIMISLIIYTKLPIYYYLIILLRDIVLLVIVVYGHVVNNPLRKPNLPSRLAMLCGGLIGITWLNSLPLLSGVFLGGLIFLGSWGAKNYYRTIKTIGLSII